MIKLYPDNRPWLKRKLRMFLDTHLMRSFIYLSLFQTNLRLSTYIQWNEQRTNSWGNWMCCRDKINRDKLWLKKLSSLRILQIGRLYKIFVIWFGPNLQVEMNWSKVLENVEAEVNLWCRSKHFWKESTELYISYVYFIYSLSTLSQYYSRVSN